MESRYEDESSGNRIKAVSTMFEIVDGLREFDEVGVSQLANHLDVPKSTVFVYLKTLEDEGFVVNDDGTYRLGLSFLELGGDIRQRLRIYQVARPKIDELSAKTGEVANLGVMERGKRVLLYSSEPSEGMFDNSPTGQYTHMHWTALGKAMLSQLPDERVDDIVDRHGLPQATENTTTDREALFDELERIRDRGYSIEDEERRNGIRALAVSVESEERSAPVSAVSISGPKRRIGDEDTDELIDLLKDTVNVIELKYEHY